MLRISRVWYGLAVCSGAFFVSSWVAFIAHSQPTSASVSSKVPFVIHKEVIHTPSTQGAPVITQETLAQRRDGSYARRFQSRSPEGEIGWTIEIFDTERRVEILGEPFTKLRMTVYRSKDELRSWLKTRHSCAAEGIDQRSLPAGDVLVDRMLGIDVVLKKQELLNKSAKEQKWIAPELDCYPLERLITFSTGAEQQHRVTGVKLGSPPDDLFEVPAEYVEASPLQIETAYRNKYPGHVFWGDKMAAIIEARYQKARVQRPQ